MLAILCVAAIAVFVLLVSLLADRSLRWFPEIGFVPSPKPYEWQAVSHSDAFDTKCDYRVVLESDNLVPGGWGQKGDVILPVSVQSSSIIALLQNGVGLRVRAEAKGAIEYHGLRPGIQTSAVTVQQRCPGSYLSHR
jgi:hypothetical protein